jgi:diguanylate cyclase (GGDEF)-like protein
LKILIAEDETISRLVLRRTLESWGHEIVETVDGAAAWEILQREDAPKLAILDLMMPGMDGVEICRAVRGLNKTTPVYIILLTANSDKQDMVRGLAAGADDYVTKPFDHDELRARIEVGQRVLGLQHNLADRVNELEITLAELKIAQEALRQLSLTDELTGLYNRRGFFTLAEQHLTIARREGKEASLIYADMDGLKTINDTLGHDEGSKALKGVAEILRKTFRGSDVVARIGGDEFVILESHASPDDAQNSITRLRENLTEYNETSDLKYQLSISTGIVRVKHEDFSTLENLLTQADELMYEEKRLKKLDRKSIS